MPCGRSGRRPTATRSSSSSSCATSRRRAAARAWRWATGSACRRACAPSSRGGSRACPHAAGHVLRVAALIGRDFDYDLLERVAEVPADELLDVLDAALRGALLAEVPSTPGRYSFAHALLRSTLEAELSATRRALLHRRIGEAIEQRHGDRLDPWLDDLARHFAEAGPAGGRARLRLRRPRRRAGHRPARLRRGRAARWPGRCACAGRTTRSPKRSSLGSRRPWPRPRRARGAGTRRGPASPAPPRRPGAAERRRRVFARAALGHSGGTWDHYGRGDRTSVALLEEALERLPAGDSRLRSQVLARLSVLLYYTPAVSFEQVLSTADAAVAIARRLGDAEALVAALGRGAARALAARPGGRPAGARRRAHRAHGGRAGRWSRRRRPSSGARWRCSSSAGSTRRTRIWPASASSPNRPSGTSCSCTATPCGRCARCSRAISPAARRRRARCSSGAGAWSGRAALRCRCTRTYAVQMVAILNERRELGRLTAYLEEMVGEMPMLPGWRAVAGLGARAGRPRRGRAGGARRAERGRLRGAPARHELRARRWRWPRTPSASSTTPSWRRAPSRSSTRTATSGWWSASAPRRWGRSRTRSPSSSSCRTAQTTRSRRSSWRSSGRSGCAPARTSHDRARGWRMR